MEVIDHGVCRLALVSVRKDPKKLMENDALTIPIIHKIQGLLSGMAIEIILFLQVFLTNILN